MKIFPFFDKKQKAHTNAAVADTHAVPAKDVCSQFARNVTTRSDQRNAARATELKIDAIESAMTRHLDLDPRLAKAFTAPGITGKHEKSANTIFQRTMHMAESSTETLFNYASCSSTIALEESLPTLVIEEAAILFANHQPALAERLLHDAILEAPLAADTEHAYLLLFDLYRITGQHQAFDRLAADYINTFKALPPAWCNNNPSSNTLATVIFPEILDTHCASQIALAQKLRTESTVLQLDLRNIRAVDHNGCTLLLQLLQSLHTSGHNLILPGAPGLIAHLQAILQVAQCDGGSAPWLLLLELLRLLNQKQKFEDSSIEYCIAFEISPPPFEAPCVQVTLAPRQKLLTTKQIAFFKMPQTVAGDVMGLLAAITAFAADRDVVKIDCSQLHCIDFSASGKLLAGLVPLTGDGKTIEFHYVNYLVAALLNAMGLKEIARIISDQD